MKKLLLFVVLSLVAAPVVGARAKQWKNHAKPYSYLFGNEIDGFQETQLKLNKDGTVNELEGYLYVTFTDASGDPIGTTSEGLPIGRHPSRSLGEICGATVKCVPAWTIRAIPGNAKFFFHRGVSFSDES